MYAATELCHVSLIQSEHTHALQFISVKLLDWKIGFLAGRSVYNYFIERRKKTFGREKRYCLLSEPEKKELIVPIRWAITANSGCCSIQKYTLLSLIHI